MSKVLMRHRLKLGTLLFLLAPTVNALTTDGQQPVQIHSDHFRYLGTTREGQYSGNVLVIQGSRHLNANEITLQLNQNKQVSDINAYGTPAAFHYQPTPNGQLVYASADTIHYQPAKNLLSLTGNAKLQQSGNTFEGSTITYNTKTEIAQSEGSPLTNRPLMIIQPKTIGS